MEVAKISWAFGIRIRTLEWLISRTTRNYRQKRSGPGELTRTDWTGERPFRTTIAPMQRYRRKLLQIKRATPFFFGGTATPFPMTRWHDMGSRALCLGILTEAF